jgi:phage recombination protein Bet
MNEQATQEKLQEAAQTPSTGKEWEYETDLGLVRLSIETVRRYFCAKANDAEIMHFMAVCKYNKLNPWIREAYLIKYQDGEPAQIVIGRDTHARRAEEHPQYAGDEGGIIVKLENGTIEYREGEFFLAPEILVGGWAQVYRKDREKPIVHRVKLSDWDTGRAFWKKSPAHMIAKVARAQARHEAFPTEYRGLISEDEMQPIPQDVIDIPMPLSNAEAAAQAGHGENGSPAGTGEAHGEDTGKGNPAGPSAGDPSLEEQERIRAQEQADAKPAEEPPKRMKVDRGIVWNEVLRKAKIEKKTASGLLVELTATPGKPGKHNMSDLSDLEVLELSKKLRTA